MAWLAATFHDQLSAGTELAIFQEPWDPQAVLPGQLPPSVDLGIEFPDGAAAVVWVRDVIGSEAVIQTSDQTKWRMVLIDLKELKYPPAPTEDAACRRRGSLCNPHNDHVSSDTATVSTTHEELSSPRSCRAVQTRRRERGSNSKEER